MAKTQGRLGSVQASSSGLVAGLTTVGGLVDGTLNGDQSSIKTTSHDSGQFEEYLPGRKSFTMDLKCHYDEADAGQGALIDSFLNGTTILFAFNQIVGSTYKQGRISGFVTKFSPGSPNDDAASVDFAVQCTGAITWTAQT